MESQTFRGTCYFILLQTLTPSEIEPHFSAAVEKRVMRSRKKKADEFAPDVPQTILFMGA